ncbi:Radical SAM superfamily protein [Clavibacter michiganensis]|uniref:Radical SAM superfamily protein n=1 Tax=Clavibacter michiganensis TaxID=28447 RepID=A0A251Y9X5_9MICO|nr:Rv2578c family radical SAM protein [Clavibacter michiganensis]OUE21045.1 Radical SAM superfamily protein [Clavibacter michiganensis]
MRWSAQKLSDTSADALPGLVRLSNLVQSVRTPEFQGVTFHEVLAKSALNRVPGESKVMPYGWTINPYRGCTHACVYCFARPTHAYLDLDGGRDFDDQIVVKVNVAEVLARELAKPTWTHDAVALGTNTDPYQRAEGRYALMPGIIAALASSGTPLSILTKGTLLRRDLPLLAEASASVPVDLAMSIAVLDDDLQQSVEPGTPTTAARLATVTAIREAGLDCTVFMMPILPMLTDSVEHLDHALTRIRGAGGTRVLYSALYLKPGVKEWYLEWLERERPELVGRYLDLYARGAYAPQAYRTWLRSRMDPLVRRHGLGGGRVDPRTGGVLSRADVPGIECQVARPAAPRPGWSQEGADSRATSSRGRGSWATGPARSSASGPLVAAALPAGPASTQATLF